MSRHQQAVIEYLQEENRIRLEQLGGKPKRFTDAQRIRLARKAKLVGRRRLGKLATLVTPDTLRWFRVLVAKKWTFLRVAPPVARRRPHRPVLARLRHNMLCTTYCAICGDRTYVVQRLQMLGFIGVLTSPTPHNISASDHCEKTHQAFLSS